MQKNIKNIISEKASIPKDVMQGIPLVRLNGKEEFYIENYRGILEYTEELIRIQTKIGQIHLQGKRLEIDYYTKEEMKVSGFIKKIEYN